MIARSDILAGKMADEGEHADADAPTQVGPESVDSLLAGAAAAPPIPLASTFRQTNGGRPDEGDLLGGRYRIRGKLGEGAFGWVGTAIDQHFEEHVHPRLRRLVAIKVLLSNHEYDDERRSRVELFRREIMVMVGITHPNVVRIFDVGTWSTDSGEHPYLVMEHLEGRTLRDVLREESRLAPTMVLDILAQVAAALAAVHNKDVVHRDLKPDNLFLCNDGQVKVLDFGVAQVDPVFLAMRSLSPTDAMRILGEDRVAGTLVYMAPEQFVGRVGPAADVWACGVVAHELLTGRRPYENFAAITEGATPSLSSELDPRVRDLVAACLVREPERRLTAAELHEKAAALAEVLRRPVAGGDPEPFRALAAFGEEHAAWFFGRHREAQRLRARLRDHRIVLLSGRSGAGKSSLAHAGLLPLLRQEQPGWSVIDLRPGPTPLETLARRVRERCPEAVKELRLTDAKMLEPGLIVTVLERQAQRTGGRILLLVDHLEELFTLGVDDKHVAAFGSVLAAWAEDPESPVRVLAVVRERFLGNAFDRLERSRSGLGTAVSVYPLSPPSRDELVEAVRGPIVAVGLSPPIAPIEKLADELHGHGAPLPLLQLAAWRWWERRDPNTGALDPDALETKVEALLADHADRVLESLPTREHELVGQLLCLLVTGEGTRMARSLAELQRRLGVDEKRVEFVLERLRAGRLLSEQEQGYELIHEGLIRGWPKLERWLAEQDVATRQLRERLEDEARRWHAAADEFAADGLPTAALLEAYEALGQDGSLGPTERRYIDAARQLRGRLQRRTRSALVGLTILVLAAFALAGFLYVRTNNLNAKTIELEHERDTIARVAVDILGAVDRTSVSSPFTAKADFSEIRGRISAADLATLNRGLVLSLEFAAGPPNADLVKRLEGLHTQAEADNVSPFVMEFLTASLGLAFMAGETDITVRAVQPSCDTGNLGSCSMLIVALSVAGECVPVRAQLERIERLFANGDESIEHRLNELRKLTDIVCAIHEGDQEAYETWREASMVGFNVSYEVAFRYLWALQNALEDPVERTSTLRDNIGRLAWASESLNEINKDFAKLNESCLTQGAEFHADRVIGEYRWVGVRLAMELERARFPSHVVFAAEDIGRVGALECVSARAKLDASQRKVLDSEIIALGFSMIGQTSNGGNVGFTIEQREQLLQLGIILYHDLLDDCDGLGGLPDLLDDPMPAWASSELHAYAKERVAEIWARCAAEETQP